jgi:hypothetical protein
VQYEGKMVAAALPMTPLARMSFNGWVRLAFVLVLFTCTALTIYQSAVMVFRVNMPQYMGASSAFEDGVPNLNPSPPSKVPETIKSLEVKVRVDPHPKKSNMTKSLEEEAKLSKTSSSPAEKKAENIDTIEPTPMGKQGKEAASTSVPDSKSHGPMNNIRGGAPASAPAFVPASNLSPNPDRVFWCGYSTMFTDLQFNLANVLFPGVPAELFEVGSMKFGPKDLLLKTRSGVCRTGKGNPKIEDVFPGKIMYVVGESDGPDPIHERVYSLGPLADSKKTIRSYFGAMVLGMGAPETQRKIFDPKFRVNNTKKKFLSYIASNCVEYREKAFRDLSTIGTVNYGGRCSGLAGGISNGTIQQSRVGGSWLRNAKGVFQDYRFGLVMENKKSDGYITEKIVNAYLSGGTVPIWYGTREIFDVFNERAFIYYDIEDPQPALDRITYLEKNQTAYAEVLKEPILANGDQTIEDYFSFRDDVGGGKLKKRIRNMLGYQ